MSDSETLRDAYHKAQQLEDMLNSAWGSAAGFHVFIEDDASDEVQDFLLEGLEERVDSAHEQYIQLYDTLEDVATVRDEITSPEHMIDDSEDRFLEEELEGGRMAEIVEHFNVEVESDENVPENPETAVRYMVEQLRGYNRLYAALQNSRYDFNVKAPADPVVNHRIEFDTYERTIEDERWKPDSDYEWLHQNEE
jgi:hypothetical protein